MACDAAELTIALLKTLARFRLRNLIHRVCRLVGSDSIVPFVKYDPHIAQRLTGAKICFGMTGTQNTLDSEQMALITDTVTLRRTQRSWVHNRIFHRFQCPTCLALFMKPDVVCCWPMAPFAIDLRDGEGGTPKTIRTMRINQRHLTDMALRTTLPDRPFEMSIRPGIAGRDVESGSHRIPRQGRHDHLITALNQIRTPACARADFPIDRLRLLGQDISIRIDELFMMDDLSIDMFSSIAKTVRGDHPVLGVVLDDWSRYGWGC